MSRTSLSFLVRMMSSSAIYLSVAEKMYEKKWASVRAVWELVEKAPDGDPDQDAHHHGGHHYSGGP